MSKVSIQVLGSSSSGNSTIITKNNKSILIDAGHTPQYLLPALKDNNIDLNNIVGIFITHLHGDHLNKSIYKTVSQYRIPIFVPPPLYKVLRKTDDLKEITSINNNVVKSDTFTVKHFEVKHDSDGGCFGYQIFSDCEKKITISTDLAEYTTEIIKIFAGSDVIIIESNHDRDMLLNSGRPQFLINRILKTGHLSNEQCKNMLKEIYKHSQTLPQAVFLAHISEQCNTPELVMTAFNESLPANSKNKINGIVTYPHKPNKPFIIQ